MGDLGEKWVEEVDKFLDDQGLTFDPLREEITDHLLMVLEHQINNGIAPEEAWKQITDEIPSNHFNTIQNQTMESINKRINMSRASSFIALGLLTITTVFKLLHLPGTTMLLFISCIAIAVSFLVSSISGIILNKEKTGSWLLGATVGSILLFLASWVFLILNLPSALVLKGISILLLLLLFPSLTITFSNRMKSETSILTYLHGRHQSGIERFLLVLLGLSIILKLSSVLMGYPPQIAWVLQVFVICAAGLNFFALTWHANTPNAFSDAPWKRFVLIMLFAVSLLPALGSLIPADLRVLMACTFYIGAGVLAISRNHASHFPLGSFFVMSVVGLFYLGWSAVHFQLLDPGINRLLFGLPSLGVFLIGLGLSRRNSLLRMYMIMVVAHMLFEFPLELSLY